jgi:cytoskeletal protein CcmA (bactofilin family)
LESNLNNLIRITQDSFFKGSYTGLGDLELIGSFEGTLKVKNLHIKKSGVFVGFVTADSIVVEGDINADIQTENLHLKSSGTINGEIAYRNIIIDSGGILKSSMVQNVSSINKFIKSQKS